MVCRPRRRCPPLLFPDFDITKDPQISVSFPKPNHVKIYPVCVFVSLLASFYKPFSFYPIWHILSFNLPSYYCPFHLISSCMCYLRCSADFCNVFVVKNYFWQLLNCMCTREMCGFFYTCAKAMCCFLQLPQVRGHISNFPYFTSLVPFVCVCAQACTVSEQRLQTWKES